jgi:hypothetical protein
MVGLVGIDGAAVSVLVGLLAGAFAFLPRIVLFLPATVLSLPALGAGALGLII